MIFISRAASVIFKGRGLASSQQFGWMPQCIRSILHHV